MSRCPRVRAITTLLVGAALFGAASACGSDGPTITPPRTAPPRSGTAVPTPRATAQAYAQRELRKLESSFQGRIGAYALNTATGATITYRAYERFGLASTFKAFAAAAILDKARRSDAGLLDRRIRWDRGDLVPNSPVTAKHVATGLTVAQLCEAAIMVSDNTAGNLLLRQIGGPLGLTRYFRSLGDPISRLDRFETELNNWRPGEKRDTTMPAYMGKDLAKLTVGNGLAAPDRARLIGWLHATTTSDHRIRAGLPKGWLVGDKTGTPAAYGGADDIAVAWPPSRAPLIIAIYTNRQSPDAAPTDRIVAATATLLARAV